jgi:filamentous hemagglutinin
LGVNTIGVFGAGIVSFAEGQFAAATVRSEATAIPLVRQNAAQGAQYEKDGINLLRAQGDINVAEQVTIQTTAGKIRPDALSINASGNIAVTEFKSSATAPLTKTQRVGFPALAQSGGVVLGKGKPGFPGGTVIPPTAVDIIRPTGKTQ